MAKRIDGDNDYDNDCDNDNEEADESQHAGPVDLVTAAAGHGRFSR
jgi:hypothetical protein